MPLIRSALLSVAPEVKKISELAAPTTAAARPLASSTAWRARRPEL
jgi:hypothetical protein